MYIIMCVIFFCFQFNSISPLKKKLSEFNSVQHTTKIFSYEIKNPKQNIQYHAKNIDNAYLVMLNLKFYANYRNVFAKKANTEILNHCL